MQVDNLEKGTTHRASLEPTPYFSYLRSANYSLGIQEWRADQRDR
jgi:hypothetical protein